MTDNLIAFFYRERLLVAVVSALIVAGGALAGVIHAIFAAKMEEQLEKLSLASKLTASLGEGGYALLGVAAFAVMGAVLFRVAQQSTEDA